MCVCVCVCVCVSVCDHVFGTARPIFTKCFVLVIYGRGSVILWRRSNMLCNSGFMDVVIFAHKPRLFDVAALLKCSLGHGYKLCAVIPVPGQRTHGTTLRALKVTCQVATPELSIGWVDPWVGLSWVEIFQFLVGWVGSTAAKFAGFLSCC